MIEHFKQRDYQTSCVSPVHQRALNTERESLLVKKTKDTASPRITLSTEYTPLAGKVEGMKAETLEHA